MVIKNVRLNRHRKADLVYLRSGIHTLATLTYLVSQKPDRTHAVQSVDNLSRTETRIQNAIVTKPYVEMGCISNQRKAEFVRNIFRIRSFCGGHGKFLPNTCFM
jgi:hypothetical protein